MKENELKLGSLKSNVMESVMELERQLKIE